MEDLFAIAVVDLGLSPDEFWEITPYELKLLMRRYRFRLDEEYNLMMAQAWYTAAFERQKRIPPLRKFLRKTVDKKVIRKKAEETMKWLREMMKNGS